jgi:membrane-bound lytic murein transglycosylase MltF
LKTSREYGFGLGQLTIAYNKDGSERMNNFKYAKTLDKSLANWKWEDRYNASYQMRTMIVMDKIAYNQMSFAKNDFERQAFMFSAYNGGAGGVIKDRAICRSTAGCDQNVWFGNVEKYSFKSKVAVKGYGKSFFEINREYVQYIMNSRWMKYVVTWEKYSKGQQ